MRVWLVKISEPIPKNNDSHIGLQRAGYFAKLLSEYGHDVIWWSSTFDHHKKTHLYFADTDVVINQHLTIKLLYAPGYKGHLSLRRVWNHWKITRKFSSAIRQQTILPDVILTSLPTIGLCYESVVFGNQRKIPVILDMRDMWPDIFVDLVPHFLRTLTRRLLSFQFQRASYACENASAIIGITDEFVSWGVKRGQRNKQEFDKSFPLGYSIQTTTIESENNAMTELGHRGINFDVDHLYALYIGTLSRNANLNDITSASRILYERNSKWQFIICGDGDYVDLIKNHVKKYPNMKYVGWVDKTMIHILMRRCHVGLNQLPDRYDFLASINNKAIEYMSAGLPIISSPDRGVLHELLKKHQCGISYSAGNAYALATMLTRFCDDREKLKIMSQNAILLFQEHFTAEKVYKEMMEHLVKMTEKFI